jgi:cation transport regulator ChaB
MADHIVIANISTEPERTYINIDGTDYGCRTANEIELKDLAMIQRMQKRQAAGLDGDNEADLDALSDMLIQMTRLVLFDAPEEVLVKLKDMHRMAIVEAFTQAVSSEKEATTKSPDSSTEESLPSSASTEEIPIAG